MENIAIGSVFEQLKILQSNLNEISEIVDNLNRSGVIEIRGKSNFAGGIKLNSSDNSKGITIQAPPSFNSNYTLTLPPGLPTEGQVLQSNLNGTLSWVNNGGNGGGNGGGGITMETDPVFTSHVAHGITQNKIDNWDTAYSWGDHSLEGYLTDAHPVFNITDTDIDNWNRVEGYFTAAVNGIVSLDGINFLMTPNAEVDQDLHVGGEIFGRASYTGTGGGRIKLVSNDHTATVEIMGSSATEYRHLNPSAAEVGGAIQLNSYDNNYGITIRAPPPPWSGSSYTLTLPGGLPATSGQVLQSDAFGTLSWVGNGGGGGSGGSNGDTAYSWGDHSLEGYLTDAHPVFNITATDIDNWDTAYSWGDHSLEGYLTDAHPAHGVTSNKIDNWDTAYSWGNHADQGYLTDAHPVFNITATDIDNWDTAYSWGNHADQGYLTDAHPASAITAAQVSALGTGGGTSSVNAETWGLRAVSNTTSFSNIINVPEGGFVNGTANFPGTPTDPAMNLSGRIFDIGFPTQQGTNPTLTGSPNPPYVNWVLDNAGRTSYTSLVTVSYSAAEEGGIFSFVKTGLYMINFDFRLHGRFDTMVNICLLTTTNNGTLWKEVRSGTTEFKYIVADNSTGNAVDHDSDQTISASHIFYVANTGNYKFKLGTRCWHHQTSGLYKDYGILTVGNNSHDLSTLTIVKLS